MKTVFFDVDTQLDFVFPAGALAVPGAENIVDNLAKLTRYAAAHSHQIVSTADAHSEDDPEFKIWKPHCVAGTVGQQKCAVTLLTQQRTLNQQVQDFIAVAQIIVEKQMLDCFTNPNLRPLLNLLAVDRYVVYGVVSEYCVKCAAMGLLEIGARVELVSDAIQTLDPAAERTLIEQFTARGGHVTTTAAVLN
jgi:nicotinamidase/pyrazinamidase